MWFRAAHASSIDMHAVLLFAGQLFVGQLLDRKVYCVLLCGPHITG
jgi:hypothetical protein